MRALALLLVGCANAGSFVDPPTPDLDAAPLPVVAGDAEAGTPECGERCTRTCASVAGKENVGCDFVVATPAAVLGKGCYAVIVANAWDKPVHVAVSIAEIPLDTNAFARIPDGTEDPAKWGPIPESGLPPGKVAAIFLSGDRPATPSVTCPVQAIQWSTALPADPTLTPSTGTAFRIKTDGPVSAYDIYPFGGAKSYTPAATMLLPVASWGTNYVAVVPPLGTGGPRWGQIVASENATTVHVVPTVLLPGGNGVAAAPKNVLTTYTLDAGKLIQWVTYEDMSGSIFLSDKPIAFNGGNIGLVLTSKTASYSTADSARQQIPPVASLGFDYVAAPYTTRMANLLPESIPYRLVGAVDGTTLSFDPPIAGAPATLGRGDVVDFESTMPFEVKSDKAHPFYLGQAMTGELFVGTQSRPDGTMPPYSLGDPDFVNIVPVAQFLGEYTFYTDVTYGTTNLSLTRRKGPSGFEAVTIDCLGIVHGWMPVGTSGELEVTSVDVVRAGIPVGSCANGAHTATSKGTFALVVWGTDHCASYGYPAGGSATPINDVVIPPDPR